MPRYYYRRDSGGGCSALAAGFGFGAFLLCSCVGFCVFAAIFGRTQPTTESPTRALDAENDAWTKGNRPDWAPRCSPEAGKDLVEIFKAMDDGLERGDWLGITVHPITIWVDRDKWGKLERGDRNWILA